MFHPKQQAGGAVNPQTVIGELPKAVTACLMVSPCLKQAWEQFLVMNNQTAETAANPQVCTMFLEMIGTSFFQLQQITMMQQQQLLLLQKKLGGFGRCTRHLWGGPFCCVEGFELERRF